MVPLSLSMSAYQRAREGRCYRSLQHFYLVILHFHAVWGHKPVRVSMLASVHHQPPDGGNIVDGGWEGVHISANSFWDTTTNTLLNYESKWQVPTQLSPSCNSSQLQSSQNGMVRSVICVCCDHKMNMRRKFKISAFISYYLYLEQQVILNLRKGRKSIRGLAQTLGIANTRNDLKHWKRNHWCTEHMHRIG